MEQVHPVPDHVVDVAMTAIVRPVFLVGCARSGTSILGEVIAAHPRVTYLYEASGIWNRLLPGRPDHRLTAADATAGIAARVRAELSERLAEPARDILVEKNPKHALRVSFLDAIFPDCRIIHLIRDGRDTAASLMFRNRGPEWGHLKIPGWEDLMGRYPGANHIRCAHQWRDSVSIARAEGRAMSPQLNLPRYFEVVYEDLIRRPEAAVGAILEFLGLPFATEVRAILPRLQDSTRGSYHARRQVRHYVDNHAHRIGRFRENLTPGQIDEVTAVCGDLLRELGYAD